MEEVKSDFLYLERKARELNLFLNHSKSEIICVDETTKQEMLSMSPNLHPTDPSLATLLGSPIGGLEALNEAWESKISHLRNLGDMLKLLQAHDAICLLRNALSMPKVLYVLRIQPPVVSLLYSHLLTLSRSLYWSLFVIFSYLSMGGFKLPSPSTQGAWELEVLFCWHPLPFWLLLRAVPLFLRLFFHLILPLC